MTSLINHDGGGGAILTPLGRAVRAAIGLGAAAIGFCIGHLFHATGA